MNYLAAPITFVARNFGVPRAHLFLPRDTHFSLEDVPDLSGKTALVTGGTEGIGLACTKTLLEHNIEKVFVLSYRRSVYEEALEKLGHIKSLKERIQWLQCDLAKWDTEVIAAADTICKDASRLDIVIANAARGIMPYQQDKHGIDLGMSVNHIGHVALISHLLPLLKKTAEMSNDPVRVVNLASMNHEHAPSDMTFENIEDLNREMGPNEGYGRTKLAAILYARWMAERLPKNILFNSTHPGVVNTAQTIDWIHDAYPILGTAMSTIMYPFKKSPEQGCISTMYAATAVTGTGQYITPPATFEAGNEKSNDKEMGNRLMKMTMEIIMDRTDAKKQGCPVKAH